MLEYLDGEMLLPENITAKVASKALDALKLIHQYNFAHLDINDHSFIKNVMVLKSAEVKWLDFEHARNNVHDGEIEFEWRLALELLGPSGCMFELKWVFCAYSVLSN